MKLISWLSSWLLCCLCSLRGVLLARVHMMRVTLLGWLWGLCMALRRLLAVFLRAPSLPAVLPVVWCCLPAFVAPLQQLLPAAQLAAVF